MSHNSRMERQNETKQSITLTPKEAEEYCAYKRQKKLSEITSAMRRAESVLTANDVAATVCQQATRLRQLAVRVFPADIATRCDPFLKSPVGLDCVVGGNGESFLKAKAYEAKLARRAGAKEITLLLTPSLIATSRYTDLKRELRRVRRAAKKTTLKARVERTYPQATLIRLARLSAECGAQYFSFPYFDGCECLQAELSGGCLLEVSGVETLADFKKTAGAGMGRILTRHAWEIYAEWLKEVEEITVRAVLPSPEKIAEAKKEKEKSVALALPIAPPKFLGGEGAPMKS